VQNIFSYKILGSFMHIILQNTHENDD